MINQNVYIKDPLTQKLVNEGVANVNDDPSAQALAVLRYELETFVCEGQYEQGIVHILRTYLKNLKQAQQPAVWISGFYGSGKSHLVKMMRALWVDTRFDDGATARGIASLPDSVSDQFRELSIEGKRHGGLHAASGTLGASASGSVRLALLRIVFKSVGLPDQYPIARFVMWLKSEGILNDVRKQTEADGYNWQEELDNFYVAEGLHEALVKAKPKLFASTASCVETLNNLFPYVQDVSSDDMLKAIRQAIMKDGKFPLTLIVLDEMQQFIGEDSGRSDDVRETVEACCKSDFGSKLLFIGTGQTAVTGTANLKKQEGRFTVRVELSDTDVDSVIRKVILAKAPEAVPVLEAEMNRNVGEISRHLQGTTLAHQQDDIQFFSQDYPILPTRRRFWEATQRVLDQTGTDSQLRNMLSMIHRVIQTNAANEVPHVIPADYLYFDSADKLLQARVLPRKVHEKTMTWLKGTDDQKLIARACGLVFLVNKLAGSNTDIGIKATVDTLADLLVEDLSQGSATLRSCLPPLLDKCELLMKIGNEYRIQTEESAAWNDEFLSQRSRLANEAHRIDAERDDRLRKRFAELAGKLAEQQGVAKVPRTFHPIFDASLPNDAAKKIYIWIQDGWSTDENSVRIEARQAGNQSPTVFVFIPSRSSTDLRHHLLEYKAATATLDRRGIPNTPEGKEARAALETTQRNAESKIQELLDDCFSGARILQGGGNEISGNNLREVILEAARNSLTRLFPQFDVADHSAWHKVYEKAKQGAPDALKAVGDEGEPAKNPVCKAILGFIAGGKSGSDIRASFEAETFGWPTDAIDGALQVLLVAGLIRAQDDRGKTVDPKELERRNIGKTTFKVEAATVSTPQRIQIRKVMQKLGIQAKQGEELMKVPEFLQALLELAKSAGGDKPQPELPDTTSIDGIRLAAGNEQLLAIYNNRDELSKSIDLWLDLKKQIAARLPLWRNLQGLLHYAEGLPDEEVYGAQAKQIEEQRLLIHNPDPITPLAANITQLLRDFLNALKQKYDEAYTAGFERLDKDINWQALEPEQRHTILLPLNLTEATQPKIELGTQEGIYRTLQTISLSALADRVAALPTRFDQAMQEAAKLLQPEAQIVRLDKVMLSNPEEVDRWLIGTRQHLIKALEKGPVVVR